MDNRCYYFIKVLIAPYYGKTEALWIVIKPYSYNYTSIIDV